MLRMLLNLVFIVAIILSIFLWYKEVTEVPSSRSISNDLIYYQKARARAWKYQNAPQKQIEIFQRVVIKFPDTVGANLAQAQIKFIKNQIHFLWYEKKLQIENWKARQKYSKAIFDLTKFLELYPNHVAATKLKNKLLQEAKRIYVEDMNKAVILYISGDKKEALIVCQRLAKTVSTNSLQQIIKEMLKIIEKK